MSRSFHRVSTCTANTRPHTGPGNDLDLGSRVSFGKKKKTFDRVKGVFSNVDFASVSGN